MKVFIYYFFYSNLFDNCSRVNAERTRLYKFLAFTSCLDASRSAELCSVATGAEGANAFVLETSSGYPCDGRIAERSQGLLRSPVAGAKRSGGGLCPYINLFFVNLFIIYNPV
jgi:hypothetical protein